MINRVSISFSSTISLETACDALADQRNAHEMRVVTPVTPVTPLAGNGGEPGLSQRDIEQIARWCENRADAQRQGGCEVDQAELDTLLRSKLAEYVLPEHVELEFGRVLQAVFRLK